MNNLREVKNDLLKDWIDYRAETIFTTLNAEDKKEDILNRKDTNIEKKEI